MAASLTDILQALQQGTLAINNLKAQIAATFPQASSLSTSATTGAISYNSSQPASFLLVTTSSGWIAKVPLFNT